MKPSSACNRICMFCSTPLKGVRAREHIIPEWLLAHLDAREDLVKPIKFDSSDTIISEREHTLGAYVAGKVCKRCNEGWMSELEGLARPPLLDLIEERRTVQHLSPGERHVLARWACKVAFCIDAASYGISRVHPDQPLALMSDERKIPRGIAVFVAVSPFSVKAEWFEYHRWKIPLTSVTEKQMRRLMKGTYKIMMHFRKCVLLVVYWPHADYSYGFDPTLLHPIHLDQRQYFELTFPEVIESQTPAEFLVHTACSIWAIPSSHSSGPITPSPTLFVGVDE